MNEFRVNTSKSELLLSDLKRSLKNAQAIVRRHAKNQSLVKNLQKIRQNDLLQK